MFSYTLKRLDYPYPPMRLEKRKGLVPKQGYCSLKPAEEEKEGLPAAAAGLRACIYGDPLREVIHLMQEDLQAPTIEKIPAPPLLADILPAVRRLLLEGKGMEAAALSAETAKKRGYGELLHFMENDPRHIELPFSAFQPAGAVNLVLELEESGAPTDYLRTMNYKTGEAVIHWTDRRGRWVRRAFVSEPEQCLVQLLTPPPGEKLNIRVHMEAPDDWARAGIRPEMQATLDALLCEACYPIGGGGHAVATKVFRTGGTAHLEDTSICINGAQQVLLVTRVTSSPALKPGLAQQTLDDPSFPEETYEALLNRHIKIHAPRIERCTMTFDGPGENQAVEELMERQNGSGLPLQAKLLQMMFDAGRYFLATATGKYPPMWGQWNINVNLQVCSGNLTSLPEMMDVFFRFVESKLPDYRMNAQRILGCRGILADIHPDLNNGLLYHFSRTYTHHYWIACAGWIYNEFWGRYLVSGDKTFLRDHVLPGLQEIALFFEDYLSDRGPDGRYLFYPCWSPENEPLGQSPVTVNAVMDIMVCREVLENLTTAYRILELEDPRAEKHREMLENLPALLLDEEGGLKEWAWKDHPERYNHRHVSHHYDVWPGMKVNWEDTPELADAILKSNRRRGQQDDSAHGIMHRLFTAIRLKDKQDACMHIQQLFRHGFVNSNLSTNHFPDRLEFPDMLGGMPAALAEMAVYSRPGIIEFLPAMPDFLAKGKLCGASLYTFMLLQTMEWDLEAGVLQAVLVSHENQICRVGSHKPAVIFRDGNPLTEQETAEGIQFTAGVPVSILLQWK